MSWLKLLKTKSGVLLILVFLLVLIPLGIYLILTVKAHSHSGQNPASSPSIPTPTNFQTPRTTPQATQSPSTHIPTQTLQQQMEAQSKADKNYSDIMKQRDQQYPWLDSLPVQTNSYFAYFKVDTKSFLAYVYPHSSSATPIDTQVSQIKQTVLSQLSRLGIDTSKYQIQWQVTVK